MLRKSSPVMATLLFLLLLLQYSMGRSVTETQQTQAICLVDEYRCQNELCIREDYKCDGKDDCGDNSDETDCPVVDLMTRTTDSPVNLNATESSLKCPGTDFKCDINRCIAGDLECDGSDHCGDRSDEKNCDEGPCNATDEFRCASGKCVPASYVCDRHDDCADMSDEKQNCTIEPCDEESQFRCANNFCEDKIHVCNGDNDCGDASDELNCPAKEGPCPDGGFRCGNNVKCVDDSQRCDGDNDCGDWSDEKNCNAGGHCRFDEFNCNNGLCLGRNYRCNGKDDCGDNSDEVGCNKTSLPVCPRSEFMCDNKRCIYQPFECNGRDDCGDKSDEKNCDKGPCTDSQFRCNNGRCVSNSVVCDRRDDCVDGSDEVNCTAEKCNEEEGEWQCDNGFCIQQAELCNGRNNCGDYSDEQRCDDKPSANCSSDYFLDEFIKQFILCGNRFKCMHHTDLCDGINNCDDWSDELVCTGTNCFVDDFRCTNELCIRDNYMCNGFDDCGDNSDETDCPGRTTDLYANLKTTESPVNLNSTKSQLKCPGTDFKCDNNRCIVGRLECDGKKHCGDRSDEKNCYKGPEKQTESPGTTSSPPLSPRDPCPSQYSHVKPAQCFLLRQTRPMMWREAEQYCAQHQGTLASLAGIREIIFLRKHLMNAANISEEAGPQFPYWVASAAEDEISSPRQVWRIRTGDDTNDQTFVRLQESSGGTAEDRCAFLSLESTRGALVSETLDCSAPKTPLCEAEQRPKNSLGFYTGY